MAQHIEPVSKKPTRTASKRPVLFTGLALFSSVYFSLMALLFLSAIFYSGPITSVLEKYALDEEFSKNQIVAIFAGGFVLHLLGLTGSILLWKLRKQGYYLLAVPCFIIALFQLFRPEISVASTFIYFLFIVLFGVFFKRFQ